MASTADPRVGSEVPGTFRCAGCGFPITLRPGEHAPECPRCGSVRFDRSSIFSPDTAPLPAPTVEREPAWLATARRTVAAGPHLAWDTGDQIETTFIRQGMTRIGRSFLAQIQLLDPTVSRRHALIHRDGDICVVLDDHSLNGVFVGGERVHWRPLEDGDEIEIGRFRLHFLHAAQAD